MKRQSANILRFVLVLMATMWIWAGLSAGQESKGPKDSPQAAAVNDDLGIVRLCLGTQNLAQDYELLKGAGVEFLSEPTEGVEGLADIAICRDPDGALIELIELHLEKWGAT